MAARRLKFKPKPLVGLIRRNKDNEQDGYKNNDLTTVESISAQATISSVSHVPSQEQCASDTNRTVSEMAIERSEQSNLLVHNKLTLDESNVEKQGVTDIANSEHTSQNDLKYDINTKIRSVLSGHNTSTSCSKPMIDSDSEICIDKDCDTQNNDQTNTTSSVQDVNDNNDILDETVNQCNRNPVQQTLSTKESITENNSQCAKPDVSSGTLDVELQNAKSDLSDKKECKNNSQRVLPRFGKSRLKPSLSNIVRNKKDKVESLIDSNKSEDRPQVLQDIPEIKKNTSVTDIDSLRFPDVENVPPIVTNEVPAQIVNQEKINECIEEPCTDVQTIKETPNNSNVEVVNSMECTEKSIESSKNDNVLASGVDTETEDSSVRTPVKLFQPNKRQRSQGQSFTSLTLKAMQNFKDKFKDGQIDKSKLMMRDLIFYNPTTNPMPLRQVTKVKKDNLKQDNAKPDSLLDQILEEEKVDDVENDENDSLPVPQVKVGPDGKIMIDPKSLVIEATGVQKNRENLEKSEVVQENEFSYSKFHRKKVRRSDWTAEETLLFYKALNDIGADFSLMQSLFPKRTRRDLKLKFKKEERVNCSLIDKAMTSCGFFDFSSLENELKKDREERIKKLEEQKRTAEAKRKQTLEKKKPAKRIPKRKSEAEREFDESDRGVTRIGKSFKSNEEKQLKPKSNINVKKQKSSKNRVLRQKNSKRKLVDDDESSQEELDMFDFRLRDGVDDNVDHDQNKDDSCDEFCSQKSQDGNNGDADSDSNDFNKRIFKKTRSGRQPKVKCSKDVKTADYIKELKKFKQSSTDGVMKDKTYTEHFIPEVPLMEAILFNEERFHRLSNMEMQERLENSYQLFGDPLDLSVQNETEILIEELSGNSLNGESYSLPVYDTTAKPDISPTSSEMVAGNSTILPTNRISDALQIVEELTCENGVNYSLQDVNESNYIYLPSDIQSKQCTPEVYNGDLMPSCSQTCENNSIEYYSSDNSNILNGRLDSFSSQPAIESQIRPSVIIKTSQPGAQIQVLSKEQFNYIFRQSANIHLQDPSIEEECPKRTNESINERITNTEIYCYPSSDHTYTSLIPKPVEPKNPFVILTPMSVKEYS